MLAPSCLDSGRAASWTLRPRPDALTPVLCLPGAAGLRRQCRAKYPKLYHCLAHFGGDRVWTGNYCFIIQHFFPFVQWFLWFAQLLSINWNILISGQGPACLLSFSLTWAARVEILYIPGPVCAIIIPEQLFVKKLFPPQGGARLSSLCKCHARKDCKVILGADFVLPESQATRMRPPRQRCSRAARKNLDPGGPTLERDHLFDRIQQGGYRRALSN